MSLSAIIVNTYHKNEKYLDSCIEILDRLWSYHPETWVLSNKGGYRYKRSVIIKSPHFVEVLCKGIEELVAKNILKPDDYILLLQEDHSPLEPVKGQLIDQVAAYASDKGLKYINLREPEKGVEAKRGERTAKIAGMELYKVCDDYKYYSGHDPAIWQVAHLIDITHKAMALGYLDPWRSEWIKNPDVPHYTLYDPRSCGYLWPSVWTGFLINNYVNIEALNNMKDPAWKKLRQILIRDYIKQAPYRLIRKIKTRISKWISQP